MSNESGDRDLPAPTLEEVSSGIFAYVQLDGSWFLNNAAALVGSDAVTVIDSCATEARTRALRSAVETSAGEVPVRTLVNSHSHGDHTYGNCVWGREVTIVGHARCREELIAAGLPQAGLAGQIFEPVDWGELALAPPSLTFDERLTLHVDQLAVELIFMGPAHTTNDVLTWVPERGVAITGDLIFHQGTPFGLGGSLAGWLVALERLRALEPATIVPGHGPVCGPEVIDDVVAYLRFVQEAARGGFEAETPPLELAQGLDLGRFAEWSDAERIVGNLHRAYSELRGDPLGAPIDGPKAIQDMVAYNGGAPLRCLA